MAHSVLLTGGAGFIGSHTAVELLQAGYDVVIADDLSNCTEDVVTRIGRITGRAPAFHQVDVADRAALEEVFEQYDFEAVIHFAGFKAVGESVKEPLKYYRNNLDTTLTLLETMAYHHVNTIVFSSSATVYGVPETVPLTEDMPTGCTNPYGWTKYMIEQILRDQAAAHPELSVVLLRYFNPIGAHPSGLIGELPQGIPNNLLPYVSGVASGRLEKLHVFGNDYPTPDGTGVRDYIHVVDLARGHLAALRYAAAQPWHGPRIQRAGHRPRLRGRQRRLRPLRHRPPPPRRHRRVLRRHRKGGEAAGLARRKGAGGDVPRCVALGDVPSLKLFHTPPHFSMFLYEKCKLFLFFSRRNYQFSSRIMRLSWVMLRLRYPNTGTRPNRMKGAKNYVYQEH